MGPWADFEKHAALLQCLGCWVWCRGLRQLRIPGYLSCWKRGYRQARALPCAGAAKCARLEPRDLKILEPTSVLEVRVSGLAIGSEAQTLHQTSQQHSTAI